MAKKYGGLFGCPASDGNFTSAIRKLSVDELEEFKAELVTRDLDEHCHKGRISAVAKEIKQRNSNSKEIIAVVRLREELQEADRLYLEGKPYDLDRIDNEVSFFQDRAGESFLEIGKRLTLVKLHEDHGKFMAFLEKHNMGTRAAQYAMAAARKFSNTQTFSYLGTGKMIALSVLDDDDVQKLANGGDVAGMTLDEIDRMTNRELRENLRKEKDLVKKEKEAREKDRDTFKRALTEKDAKINEMDMRINGQEPPTREQLAGVELEKHLKPFNAQLQDAIFAMNRCAEMIAEIQRIENIGYVQLNAWVLKQSEDIENFTESFTELQDALNDIHIDRADAGEAGTDG